MEIFMDRGRKNRSRSWNKNKNDRRQDSQRDFNKNDWNLKGSKISNFKSHIVPETPEETAKKEAAIRELKKKENICPACGKPITELTSCMTDKDSGAPVHFDCILEKLVAQEKPGPNEKVTYIGNGKFALLYFENPHDTKHFQIRKTIEWENQETNRAWRDEISGLYSQVK